MGGNKIGRPDAQNVVFQDCCYSIINNGRNVNVLMKVETIITTRASLQMPKIPHYTLN